VKLEKEDKALLLLSFLPPSYDHLATIHHVWNGDLRVERYQADAPK